jgi:hypothetical protein
VARLVGLHVTPPRSRRRRLIICTDCRVARFGPTRRRTSELCQTGAGTVPRMRLPRTKAQRRRQRPPWPGGQLDEFLGRQAAVQQASTHEHGMEGARIAPSVTEGAGAARHFLDRRTRETVGSCPAADPRPVRTRLPDRGAGSPAPRAIFPTEPRW